ncbi:MAG TPA: hypothetical protein DCR43_04930 [Bacteroidales bacterium]|nr:MAG: hypothetical protein A2X11_01845 [Bacteroidetes bacterium GWE2_42_24]OFY29695.1 MAG: hypothetical protein A2X09_01325 [Bacteroidetes bacterium GWF2_43_11]HAQ65184.1 hypothetical protein [Bacteroidales bacterium]HBZ65811.1 hypothetical protein [Bacteroidales bacterium]
MKVCHLILFSCLTDFQGLLFNEEINGQPDLCPLQSVYETGFSPAPMPAAHLWSENMPCKPFLFPPEPKDPI